MSKRMIYAEDVKEQIDEWLDAVGTAPVGKWLSYYYELLGCLDDAQTAYDLETVVHQLEELAERHMKNSEKAAELGREYQRHMIVNGAKGIAFEQAIDIVRKGGVK